MKYTDEQLNKLGEKKKKQLLRQRAYSKAYYEINKTNPEWKKRKNKLAALSYHRRKLLKQMVDTSKKINTGLQESAYKHAVEQINYVEPDFLKAKINESIDKQKIEQQLTTNDAKYNDIYMLFDDNYTWLGSYLTKESALEDAKYYAKEYGKLIVMKKVLMVINEPQVIEL